MREVSRRFGLSRSAVAKWRDRTQGLRLDRADFEDARRRGHPSAVRTPAAVEDLVLALRAQLAAGVLGECGARAIREEMLRLGGSVPPSLRTIGRILERRGALDGRRRVRRPAPAPGWYLPELAERRAELDSFDVVEGLVFGGGLRADVLTGISLHGKLVAAWPGRTVTARRAVRLILSHWREHGLPDYAQFDNDRRFQGPHRYPDTIGRVVRVCLALGVVPVFAPPREHGLQSSVERFNLLWQQKVWARFHHADLAELRRRGRAYVEASRWRHRARIDAAPARRTFPAGWKFDVQAPLRRRIVYVRRADEDGRVRVLGRAYNVDPRWAHRLVRCDVDLDAGQILFHGLRRAEPSVQPLLCTAPYRPPRKRFRE